MFNLLIIFFHTSHSSIPFLPILDVTTFIDPTDDVYVPRPSIFSIASVSETPPPTLSRSTTCVPCALEQPSCHMFELVDLVLALAITFSFSFPSTSLLVNPPLLNANYPAAQVAPFNTHWMVMHAKDGISKLKTIHSLSMIPTSFILQSLFALK